MQSSFNVLTPLPELQPSTQRTVLVYSEEGNLWSWSAVIGYSEHHPALRVLGIPEVHLPLRFHVLYFCPSRNTKAYLAGHRGLRDSDAQPPSFQCVAPDERRGSVPRCIKLVKPELQSDGCPSTSSIW